jgi:hypothetical protein
MVAHFMSLCRIACMWQHSTWHLMSDIICSRRWHVTKFQDLTTQEQGAGTAVHLILLTECRILLLSHLEYGRRRCRASHLGHIEGRQQASWTSTCSKRSAYRLASYSLRSKAAGRTAHFMSLASHLIFLPEHLIFVASAHGRSCRIARIAFHLAHRACHLCRLRSLSHLSPLIFVATRHMLSHPKCVCTGFVGVCESLAGPALSCRSKEGWGTGLRFLCRACPQLP